MAAVVGNYVGEGNEKLGKIAVLVGVIYTGTVTSLCAFLTYSYADNIAMIYTEDVELIILLVPLLKAQCLTLTLHGFL